MEERRKKKEEEDRMRQQQQIKTGIPIPTLSPPISTSPPPESPSPRLQLRPEDNRWTDRNSPRNSVGECIGGREENIHTTPPENSILVPVQFQDQHQGNLLQPKQQNPIYSSHLEQSSPSPQPHSPRMDNSAVPPQSIGSPQIAQQEPHFQNNEEYFFRSSPLLIPGASSKSPPEFSERTDNSTETIGESSSSGMNGHMYHVPDYNPHFPSDHYNNDNANMNHVTDDQSGNFSYDYDPEEYIYYQNDNHVDYNHPNEPVYHPHYDPNNPAVGGANPHPSRTGRHVRPKYTNKAHPLPTTSYGATGTNQARAARMYREKCIIS
jgi:hypothetical protein